MYGEAAVYEGQRDELTIANGAWFSRGRLQEASVFGGASLALKVDRATAVLERIKLRSVQRQYTIRAPIEGWTWSNAGVRESFMKFIIFGLLSFLC